MHISKFRIQNYKSFLDSGEVVLESGINIITGQNNAGKTALLQCLSLSFSSKPHRSTTTLKTSISKANDKTILEIEIQISREELQAYIYENFIQFAFSFDRNKYNTASFDGKSFFEKFIFDENIIKIEFEGNKPIKANLVTLGIGNGVHYNYTINKDKGTLLNTGSTSENSFLTIANLLKNRFYFFHAERLNIGSYKFGKSSVLRSNAGNLPEVLEILQGQKTRFNRYLNYVKMIFPQICDISVRPDPRQEQNVEIVIWNEDPKLERYDLVVPLSECGTGLGQVLAILYVVLTSDVPKVIIIDEPNSFLHPGASRKLIEILKEHPQHQFIISTHSPSTISAANPTTINIIKTENAQSFVESIDVNETSQQQLYLAAIGAKLSDVFGADYILWVEGKTEEICFPKIIEATEGISLMGTSILGVKNTGDFYSKKSELVFDIYRRLSEGKGLMPAAVGFVFDQEGNTEKEIADLKRKSKNKVKFIDRRLYENYLLNPKAICAILNNIGEIKIEQEAIEEWIESNKWNRKFITKDDSKIKTKENWLEKVDGANFLSSLFTELTKSKVQFDKIMHSVALTEWIIANSIDDLKELQELLSQILKPAR